MFISIIEIDHLISTSCVCLDWIDHWSFTLIYRLFHIWYSPTTYKTLIQLTLISFVWLYMFKCDVYAQLYVNQTQKYFWVFYMFLKVILYFLVFSFWSKCIFVFFFKNWFRGCFARSLRLRAFHEMCLREIKKSHFHTECLTIASQVFRD